MNNESIIYPIRLNRYLYLKGFCSRREADRLIEKGLIKINGKVARLGEKMNKDDKLSIPRAVTKEKSIKKYYILNKPVGVVSHNPQLGEKSAEEFFVGAEIKKLRMSPMGRLDKASSGLMLFSNDGTIVDRLLNPKYDHEKEYVIGVDKRITPEFIEKMARGVNIEGYKTKRATVTKKDSRNFRIVLTEGKKHQIRRMCAALGYQVKTLHRVRIMNIRLGKLKLGSIKEVKGLELVQFLQGIGVMKKKD